MRRTTTHVRNTVSALFLAGVMCTSLAGNAAADAGFQKWINGFYSVAAKSGIKKSTYNAVFAGVTSPDPEVIKAANYQPEFKSKVWEYMDTRITERSVRIGQEMKVKYKKWLDIIEPKFGVDRHILLAIWSMETSYGKALERQSALRSISRSLATLAYKDKRRAKFARNQLIAALKIVQRGDVSASGLRGSWAGAMGHTQFIPTSYQTWAVDIDGDGRRNVWTSIPDALASAANLLKKNGWQTGKTWGYEVNLPAGYNIAKAGKSSRKLSDWARTGIRRVKGRPFPRPSDRANLKVLAGPKGPAFLMTKNFFVLKRYNNADKYALAVGHLADQIAGYGPLVNDWPRGYIPLNEDERKELQQRLLALGFYNGEIDGAIGSGSRKAIKAYQSRVGLEASGIASKKLLARIRKS